MASDGDSELDERVERLERSLAQTITTVHRQGRPPPAPDLRTLHPSQR